MKYSTLLVIGKVEKYELHVEGFNLLIVYMKLRRNWIIFVRSKVEKYSIC